MTQGNTTATEQWHEGFRYDSVGNSRPFVCRCDDDQHRRAVSVAELLTDHNDRYIHDVEAAALQSMLADLKGKLAEARAVLQALVEIGCVSISDMPCSERTDGYEGCTRCAAIANYRKEVADA